MRMGFELGSRACILSLCVPSWVNFYDKDFHHLVFPSPFVWIWREDENIFKVGLIFYNKDQLTFIAKLDMFEYFA